VKLVKNPSQQEMQDWIANAQINILPSFSSSGIKLKLLHALYKGRHCIVNDATVSGSGLEQLCTVANTSKDFKSMIEMLYHQPFNSDKISERKKILESLFDNDANAIKLMDKLFYQV
jgi:hypothetical protein